jgi:hypothetical protein
VRSKDPDVRELSDLAFTTILMGLVEFKNPFFQEWLDEKIDELLKKKGES